MGIGTGSSETYTGQIVCTSVGLNQFLVSRLVGAVRVGLKVLGKEMGCYFRKVKRKTGSRRPEIDEIFGKQSEHFGKRTKKASWLS